MTIGFKDICIFKVYNWYYQILILMACEEVQMIFFSFYYLLIVWTFPHKYVLVVYLWREETPIWEGNTISCPVSDLSSWWCSWGSCSVAERLLALQYSSTRDHHTACKHWLYFFKVLSSPKHVPIPLQSVTLVTCKKILQRKTSTYMLARSSPSGPRL